MGIREGLLLGQYLTEAPERAEEAKLKAALYKGQAEHENAKVQLIQLKIGQQQRIQEQMAQSSLEEGLFGRPSQSQRPTLQPQAQAPLSHPPVKPEEGAGAVPSDYGSGDTAPLQPPGPAVGQAQAQAGDGPGYLQGLGQRLRSGVNPQAVDAELYTPQERAMLLKASILVRNGEPEEGHKLMNAVSIQQRQRFEREEQQLYTELGKLEAHRQGMADAGLLTPKMDQEIRSLGASLLYRAQKPAEALRLQAGDITVLTAQSQAFRTYPGGPSAKIAENLNVPPVVAGPGSAVGPRPGPGQPFRPDYITPTPEPPPVLVPPNTTVGPRPRAGGRFEPQYTSPPSPLQETQMRVNEEQIKLHALRQQIIPEQILLSRERIMVERERLADLREQRSMYPSKAKEIDQKILESQQRIAESQQRVARSQTLTPLEASAQGARTAETEMRTTLLPLHAELLKQRLEESKARVQELQQQMTLFPDRQTELQTKIEEMQNRIEETQQRIAEHKALLPGKLQEQEEKSKTAELKRSKTQAEIVNLEDLRRDRQERREATQALTEYLGNTEEAAINYQELATRMARVDPKAAASVVLQRQRQKQPNNTLETIAAQVGIPLGEPWTPEQASQVMDEFARIQGDISGKRGTNLPLHKEVQDELQGLLIIKNNFTAIKSEFSDKELQQYVGFLQRPAATVEAIMKDVGLMKAEAKGDAKYARFLTLVGEIFAISGFSKGGKAFTGPERELLQAFTASGNEQTYARFKANLDHGVARIDQIIEQRVLLATTPREELQKRVKERLPIVPQPGAFSSSEAPQTTAPQGDTTTPGGTAPATPSVQEKVRQMTPEQRLQRIHELEQKKNAGRP